MHTIPLSTARAALTSWLALSAAAAAQAATYVVTNASNSGAGSFRQAILNANANPGIDEIIFDIPGSGPHNIVLSSALPAITDTVSIDGSTQSGFFGGNPVVALDGTFAGTGANGLDFSAGTSQVGWLIINDFDGHGLVITGSAQNMSVVGCWIGLSQFGTVDPNQGYGVFIDDRPNNTIGGITPLQRNVISGNGDNGIRIEGSNADGNRVRGNYIGLNPAGTEAITNGVVGIHVTGCTDTLIGGTTAGAGNVIVDGNIGILLRETSTRFSVVQGNLIGTNAAGTKRLSNAWNGIDVLRAPDTLVGGTSAAARNVIVAGGYGVSVSTFSYRTRVEGNYVGTDITGQWSLGGNTFGGVEVFNVDDVVIGGDSVSARNVISGNTGDGVALVGSSSYDANPPIEVKNNFLGVAADGVKPLPNGVSGIRVSRPSGVIIGGVGVQNTIVHNGDAGIRIVNSFYPADAHPSHEVDIRANRIFSNGGLGIDLSMDSSTSDGVTFNDAGDFDEGPNRLQNFPVLTSISLESGQIRVQGSLNGPNGVFRTNTLRFYDSSRCDPSGYGEGETLIDEHTWSLSVGTLVFNRLINYPAGYGTNITVTATDTAGNTSEFSNCLSIDAPSCGGGGSCYLLGVAGCDDADCCNFVCDEDAYCCDTAWDAICVRRANRICRAVKGDANCDGEVDTFDIDAFVLALSDPSAYLATYPGCGLEQADMNGDGETDTFDVDAFVEAISQGGS